MIKYSIIIPTHNRHNLMEKNIQYFSPFKDCQIYICDSSKEPFLEKFPININYIHMPNKSFVQKMHEIIDVIKTDYIAVCADDDFIIEETVLEIVNKMEHENYVMGTGAYFGFDIPFKFFYPIYTYVNFSSIQNNNPIKRINKYMKNYYMSLWSVYKKDVIQSAYKILDNANYKNDNFIELTIAITCSSLGKIYFSKNILGLRECQNIHSQSWKDKQSNLLNYSKENSIGFNEDMVSLNNYFDNNVFFSAINIYLKKIKKDKFTMIKKIFYSKIYSYRYKNNFRNKQVSEIINNIKYCN